MTTKQTKTLRFDRELIKKAEIMAKAEKRSFNNWLELLIEREIGNTTRYLLSNPENAKRLIESIGQANQGKK